MTNEDFSNRFDTLISAYKHTPEFGNQASLADVSFDEYEKSLFLTQAQDQIVKSYFMSNVDTTGGGFDGSARRQVDFSSLITVDKEDPVNITTEQSERTFDDRGILFSLPMENGITKVLFILNEKLLVTNSITGTTKSYVIVPINYREYDREMSKAYAQPLKKQAWRLFNNNATGFDVQSEIIPNYYIAHPNEGTNSYKYYIRYVKRPQPIVLTDLPDNLEINGVSSETQCQLNPILHEDILQQAVTIALNAASAETIDIRKAKQQQQRQNN